MAEESNHGESGPLPPKLDLRKSGILKSPQPAPVPVTPDAAVPKPVQPAGVVVPAGPIKPLSVTLGAAGSAPTPGADAAKPVSKKETSRIPLDAARSRADAPAGMTPASAVRSGKPGETAQIASTPKPVDTSSAEKRKTSRISLEAVLGDGGDERTGPPTIRLKRPGEASSPSAKTVKAGTTAGAGGGDDAAQTPTQRKTVVIRRSGTEGIGPRKLTVARTAPVEEAAEGELDAQFFAVEKQPHWFFGVVSIAATLTIGVLIYVFCAQAIGPNSSQMQYSWWTEGPDLSWPGKIAGN